MDRLFIDESAPEPKIVLTRKLDDSEGSRIFSPLEFLAELSAHISNSWEQTTRFYAARFRHLRDKASPPQCYDQVLRSSIEASRESNEEPPEPSLEFIELPTSMPASKCWAHQELRKVD